MAIQTGDWGDGDVTLQPLDSANVLQPNLIGILEASSFEATGDPSAM